MRYLPLFLIACGMATGKVQIVVTPEDTVTNGLAPGDEEEDIRDGWTVTYDKFLITLGDFTAQSSANGKTLEDSGSYLLDLKSAGSNGVLVTEFAEAPADIRFDIFGYSMLTASAATKKIGTVSDADFKLMADNGYSLYIKGTMAKDGETLRFAWGFAGATKYGTCGAEGVQPGFAVTSGQTTTLEPTIHGDHWFFTNNPHTTTPKRLAEWIAKCNTNGDDEVTLAELAMHSQADLFSPVDGYNLSSLPVQPINTGFDYFAAQARTIGHFQGDGDCEGLQVLK